MKFREETYKENGRIIKKYFIDDKEVTQDVFFKLTDELYENTKFKQDEHPNAICTCDDCQYLLDLVREIKIASDSEALDILKNEIDFRVQEAYLEGQRVLANELGNYFLKYTVQLENEIDSLYENGTLDDCEEGDI